MLKAEVQMAEEKEAERIYVNDSNGRKPQIQPKFHSELSFLNVLAVLFTHNDPLDQSLFNIVAFCAGFFLM
jgi:hypothetical protein